MASLSIALPYILGDEGGIADNQNDKGKLTYEGISIVYWPTWGGWAKINTWIDANGMPETGHVFTESEIPGLAALVLQFYTDNFWNLIKGDDIDDQSVATYFMDWFVTSEHAAVNKLQAELGIDPQTGNFGPVTLAAVNTGGGGLLARLHQVRAAYYIKLAQEYPNDKCFVNGWENRTNNLYNALSNAV